MEGFKRFLREHWLGTGVVVLLLLGAFLRWYHLGEWLHFEIDQARDVKVIEKAVAGNFGDLPLLGPRAGGTQLRLGPGFYYLEYLSALLFGASPEGVAWLQSILSVATIGIFFLFVRRFFSAGVALGLTAVFTVSPFLVVYGRFAWNPNTLPFFLMGGFLALLYAVDDGRRRAQWLVLAAFLLGFATHLHFVAFVSLPVIVAVFLAVRRPQFSWRVWTAAFVVATFLYVPVAINEWATGGANAQQFLLAVSGKSNKEQHTLWENVYKTVANSSELSWIMLSGHERITWPAWVAPTLGEANITCKESCRQTLWATLLSVIVLFGGGLIFFLRLYESWKARETNPARFNTLFLVFLWFGACLTLFIPLAYNFSPRFFLLVAPLPFLALGFLVEFLAEFLSSLRWRAIFWVVIFASFFGSASFATGQRFLAWASAGTPAGKGGLAYRLEQSDQIMQEKAHIVLSEQRAIIAWMGSFQKANSWPVYFFGEPEYRRSLRYVMENEQKLFGDVTKFSVNDTYTQGNYFFVARSNDNALKKTIPYQAKNNIVEQKSFGTLTVFRLEPRAGTTAAEQAPKIDPKASPESVLIQAQPGEPVRYTWNEWRKHQGGEEDTASDDEEAAADNQN